MKDKPPSATPADRGVSSAKVTHRLVALGSAAVLTVYAAGYLRTRTAAQQLDAAERSRVVIPGTVVAAGERPAPGPSARPISAAAPVTAAASRPAPPPAAAVNSSATARTSATLAPPSSGATAATVKKPKGAVPTVKPAAVVVAKPAEATSTAEAPKTEAAPVVDAPAAPVAPPAPQWKDGTYTGWGTSRHGDIQATVVIEAGRISSAVISQCWTRYSCSWVAHLQGQVVTRQSPEVDWVSGATQSVNAFYYAVVEALSKAK